MWFLRTSYANYGVYWREINPLNVKTVQEKKIQAGALPAYLRTLSPPANPCAYFALAPRLQALSIYGYSLTPFVAATPLCLLSWPFRSCGFATTSLLAAIFVLRSSWPRLHEHMPEKSMMLLLAAISIYHFLWFLWLTSV